MILGYTSVDRERHSVPACRNVLKRIEDLAIVTDLADEPFLATKTAAVDMRGGKFNDLAQERCQLSLYHLWKEKRTRRRSIENTSLADVGREGVPFLYTTGKPLIIISQQLKGEKAHDLALKEPAYPQELANKDGQAPFVLLGFCSVVGAR